MRILRESRKKIIVMVAVLALALVSGVIAWLILRSGVKVPNETSEPVTNTKTQDKPPVAANKLTFAAMGDMLAHDSVVANAKSGAGYDFTQFFSKIRSTYNNADVVFCNPETPAAGEALGISGYPTFNAPTEFARDLSRVGCNMINLATNHMYDKGQAGVDATLRNWADQKPLAISGANSAQADRDQVAYFTKNGIKVAFVAFMDFSNSAVPNNFAVESYHDEAHVRTKLADARQNADVVVVSAHWGTEDSTTINTDQQAAAKLFSELGADVIIGTGPHVLQKVESIPRADGGSTLVFYSLGNMLSTQLAINELTGGIAMFEITKDEAKSNKVTITKTSFYPTYMAYDWPAADRAAQLLSTRTNLMIYPLSDVGSRVETMFPGENGETRQKFVTDTLGSGGGVTFTP